MSERTLLFRGLKIQTAFGGQMEEHLKQRLTHKCHPVNSPFFRLFEKAQ